MDFWCYWTFGPKCFRVLEFLWFGATSNLVNIWGFNSTKFGEKYVIPLTMCHARGPPIHTNKSAKQRVAGDQ